MHLRQSLRNICTMIIITTITTRFTAPFILILSFPSRLLSSPSFLLPSPSSISSPPLYLSDSAIAASTELPQQVPRPLPDPRLPRHHPPFRVCVPEQVGHDGDTVC